MANKNSDIIGVSIFAIVLTTATGSTADDWKPDLVCQGVGDWSPQPLGDREGHQIAVEQDSCRVTLGPMAGGVLTGTVIWELDGPGGVLLQGGGVVRKSGSVVVYQLTEGKNWDGGSAGKGRVLLATGSAKGQAGATFTFSARETGSYQWEAEDKFQ